ncbi:predicted protein [Coccidioides posadasii str. Silveira]|uniref:Predicted protein n=1 Tax=Coccidioides posadasii (strain RMSCC 757 / Silveira) TaxID=443226 RepID=E9DJ30_COCPS|nr:predicted protein [Coccidioides posadasii str. Silveira]
MTIGKCPIGSEKPPEPAPETAMENGCNSRSFALYFSYRNIHKIEINLAKLDQEVQLGCSKVKRFKVGQISGPGHIGAINQY